MKRNVDDETKEIIQSFIAEGYERLDDAEARLENLGKGDDRETLNAVFRLFHSIKGSAGFLDFERIKSLTHEAEALLELFLKQQVPCTPESLDVIYATIDLLRRLIELVEKDFADEDLTMDVAEQVMAIKAHADGLREGLLHVSSQPPHPDIAGDDAAPSASSPSLPEPALHEAAPDVIQNWIPLNELVTRDMAERFVVESADLLEKVERDVLTLKDAADQLETVHSMFRSVHTIKGNAGFFSYALLEKLCMETEHFLDGARKGEVPLNESFTNTVLSRVDFIRLNLGKVHYGEEPPEAGAAGESGYKPLGEILVDMGVTDEASVQKVLTIQEKPVGELLVEAGAARVEDVRKALEIQKTLGGEGPPAEDIKRREIRVDTAKLDKLFDLVGELITAESMVANSSDLAGLKLDSFSKSFSSLAKISREIQETAMMIRMIPLDGLFHKMSRLVRDLSRKFNKPVDLHVSGEDTEMDKNVIEHVSDPLVHILRNALDHGLESQEERLERGKSAVGSITVSARYEGSEIWISIKDDGAGLAREKILAKAVDRGLVDSGGTAALSDQQIWDFIFEPGFSTSAVVTDVSGRGVGMDVVKRNLEKIRGRVDVLTEESRGTEFILKIPLTLAIIDGITVRVGHNFYSIPLADILEFFKARTDQISHGEGSREMVNLRGNILPLLKLSQLFRIPDGALVPTEGIILVVQSLERRACLLIDEVVGNQQIVIKSLSEYIGKVEGLSGCSILGDGTVSFIIDTQKLMSLALE